MNLPADNSYHSIELFFKKNLEKIYPQEEINTLFYLLLEGVFGITKSQFMLGRHQQKFTESDINKILKPLNLLQKNHPIQYILGKTDFYNLTLRVNPNVLIPRPETEELVHWIIESCTKSFSGLILDIGTGSGAIALALQKALMHAEVVGWDVSSQALKVAELNAQTHHLPVSFLQMDILQKNNPLDNSKPNIIVSNPPYVLTKEKEAMQPNVKDHEPSIALFVANDKPLVFYDAIARFALENLQKNGYLFFEINEKFGQETIRLLTGLGFQEVKLKKDINGKDRMVRAKINHHKQCITQ